MAYDHSVIQDDIPGSNLLSNEEIHASCSSSESDLDEKDNGNNESNENHLEDFVIPIEVSRLSVLITYHPFHFMNTL